MTTALRLLKVWY